MKVKKNRVIFFVLLFLLVGSGFFIDFFKLNINQILTHLQRGTANFAHPSFNFLTDWSIKEIMILKWVLTIIIIAYYWMLSYFTLYFYFDSKRKCLEISFVYIALLTASAVFFTIGYSLGIEKSMYHVVRTIVGVAQSFLPFMIVFLYMKYVT